MTIFLTPAGYKQTKAKLNNLEKRLAKLKTRADLDSVHFSEAQRSYLEMIRQYQKEIKLYEASQTNHEESVH